MNETGRLWRENLISVAEEHLITAQVRRLSHAFFRSLPAESRRSQLLALFCVPGEEHEIGAELLSLFLETRGWPVAFIGHSTPETEIVRFIINQKPFAAVLSATRIANLPSGLLLIARLKEKMPNLKMIAGGRAFSAAHDRVAACVDGIAGSFAECHRMLLSLTGSHE